MPFDATPVEAPVEDTALTKALIAGKAMIADKNRWTKHSEQAWDKTREQFRYCAIGAIRYGTRERFRAIGAIRHGGTGDAIAMDAINFLSEVALDLCGTTAPDFNDRPTTGHLMVLRLFDKAIERSRLSG